MNTLITGFKASGKTLLANALADDYRKQGHNVVLIEADKPITTKTPDEDTRVSTVLRLYRRKHRETEHLIVTTQSVKHLNVKPFTLGQFFDYYVNTKVVREGD